MSPNEITHLIQVELLSETNLENVFGLDLTKCLIEPTKNLYNSATIVGLQYQLWTVLEETEDGSGYKIYYDEDTNMFGLGIKSNKDELIDIGSYGTFLETLYSM